MNIGRKPVTDGLLKGVLATVADFYEFMIVESPPYFGFHRKNGPCSTLHRVRPGPYVAL